MQYLVLNSPRQTRQQNNVRSKNMPNLKVYIMKAIKLNSPMKCKFRILCLEPIPSPDVIITDIRCMIFDVNSTMFP
jgi:hypothetical protein